MAWTTPMTFVAGRVLTAAQMNTHLRDNLLETLPARCTQAGEYFVVDERSRMIPRLAGKNTILTSETTASADWTDLATIGPSVTLTTGDSVMIYFGCNSNLGADNAIALMSVQITPATTDDESTTTTGQTVAPDDSYAYVHQGANADQMQGTHHIMHLGSLTEGSNTFTCKYRVIGGTACTFLRRRISVMSIT